MLFYRVKNEFDKKPMFIKKRGGIEYWSIYVGGELFTANEVTLRHLNPDYMYPVEVNRRKTQFVFGARMPMADASITAVQMKTNKESVSDEMVKNIVDFVAAADRPQSERKRGVVRVCKSQSGSVAHG